MQKAFLRPPKADFTFPTSWGRGTGAGRSKAEKRAMAPPKPVDEVPILDGKLNSSFVTERYIRLVSYPSTCYRRFRFCSERLIAANTDRKA